MKQRFSSFFLLIFAFSCTSYHEAINKNLGSYKDLSPSTVKTNLAVVNLFVNEEQFDDIHKNYEEEKDIDAYFSVYRNQVKVLENLKSEIQIKGSFSATFPLKSLGVKFDKTIDNSDNKLILPVNQLSIHDLSNIKALRLRQSGNDFLYTMIKENSYRQLAVEADLNLDLNYSEQAIVFVNDKFHGLMNMNSEVNANGISRLYNIPKNSITLAKVNNPGHIHHKDGDITLINDFMSAIEAKDTTFLLNSIDQEGLIDYLFFQSFIAANWDWPYNNVRFYSTPSTKWRFPLYDLDWANSQFLTKYPVSFITSTTDNLMSDLFLLLLDNYTFAEKYRNRSKELLASGNFHPEKFAAIVQRNAKNFEPFMPYQIEKYQSPATMVEWRIFVEELKSNYSRRYKFITKRL